MDEPSTGLDPASRNSLWTVVKKAKKERAIILTSNLSLSLCCCSMKITTFFFFFLHLHLLENPVSLFAAHSMEEAEVLCDRLGIFVDGSLQCIGNPKEVYLYVICINLYLHRSQAALLYQIIFSIMKSVVYNDMKCVAAESKIRRIVCLYHDNIFRS